MLQSFEDTGCFINANYYIQVCYLAIQGLDLT